MNTTSTGPAKKRRSKRMPHTKRERWRGMSHVIWKLKPGLETLRQPGVLRVLEPAFRKGKEKQGFRLIAWSLQEDHIHLIVEGESTEEVARGIQGLGVSITRRLNSSGSASGRARCSSTGTTRSRSGTTSTCAGPCPTCSATASGTDG